MSELLHQNSKGVKIVREDYKKRSQVKVFSEFQGKRYTLHSYRFDLIPDRFDSPFCSWANLDCCGGWSFNEKYLDTAVQKGKKLYAGRVEFVKSSFSPDLPSMDEAVQEFQKIVDGLSSGIIAGIESSGSREDMKGYLYTFICREGKITDYFDLNKVFEFYSKLGLNFPQYVVAQVKELLNNILKNYDDWTLPENTTSTTI